MKQHFKVYDLREGINEQQKKAKQNMLFSFRLSFR